MCKFDSLPVGESLTLIIPTMFCTKCGQNIQEKDAGAIYLGHSVDGNKMMDCFSVFTMLRCSSCHIRFTQYQEICGNGYGIKQSAKLYTSNNPAD